MVRWPTSPFPTRMNLKNVLLERITCNARQTGGRPCIRGLRVAVAHVSRRLAADVRGRAPHWKSSGRMVSLGKFAPSRLG